MLRFAAFPRSRALHASKPIHKSTNITQSAVPRYARARICIASVRTLSTHNSAPRNTSTEDSTHGSSSSLDHPSSSSPSKSSNSTGTASPDAFSDDIRRKGKARVEEFKRKAKLWLEDTAVATRQRADHYTALAAATFAQVGRELNKVTGYEEIEDLKRRVADQEHRIKTTREAARQAKHNYELAVQQRARSQREVNDLLQRKSTWSDDDVGRFTSLVRQDHLYEQAEARAKAAAESLDDEVEREFSELMRVILNRYHEEQVWSDKIRSASTYGSITVLGLNMLVFLLAIIVVEPWKRRKLAQTFERKVDEMSETTQSALRESIQQLRYHQEEQNRILLKSIVTAAASVQQGFLTAEAETSSPPQPSDVNQFTSSIQRLCEDHALQLTTSAISACLVGWCLRAYLCT